MGKDISQLCARINKLLGYTSSPVCPVAILASMAHSQGVSCPRKPYAQPLRKALTWHTMAKHAKLDPVCLAYSLSVSRRVAIRNGT